MIALVVGVYNTGSVCVSASVSVNGAVVVGVTVSAAVLSELFSCVCL